MQKIDHPGFRRCPECGQTKPATDEYFYVNWSPTLNKKRISNQCRPCKRAESRARAADRRTNAPEVTAVKARPIRPDAWPLEVRAATKAWGEMAALIEDQGA